MNNPYFPQNYSEEDSQNPYIVTTFDEFYHEQLWS